MPYPKKQVSRICESCGKEFSVKASLAANRRYCSWACRVSAGKQSRFVSQCAQCGKPFETYRANPQKYCSISCGITARNLTDANPSYRRDISGERNPMRGRGLRGADNPMYGKRGEKNPAWRGGRKIRDDGYVLVAAPADHPHPISDGRGRTGYVLEHRLVMEEKLGRYLLPPEVVHHIDGNPSNNSPDNLQLCSSQAEHLESHPGLPQSGITARQAKDRHT